MIQAIVAHRMVSHTGYSGWNFTTFQSIPKARAWKTKRENENPSKETQQQYLKTENLSFTFIEYKLFLLEEKE